MFAAAGDAARQMAGAPLKGNDATPAAKVNRFDKLFTSVNFKASDADTIYVNERSGQKSKKLASVLVELAGTGGYVRGTVYAKQGKNDKTARAEFTFMGTMQANCIVVDDPAAKAELDAWRQAQAAAYIVWAAATGHQTPINVSISAPLSMSLDPTPAPTA